MAAPLVGCEPAAGTPTELPRAATPNEKLPFAIGDTFEIRVFGEETLSGEQQVLDDGTINFPLLGAIAAEGRTQAELSRDIETKLADGYLRNPHVTIVIKERAMLEEISVLGQVQKPGTFSFVDQMTLVQAISNAGGMTPLAAAARVKLTRRTDAGAQTFEISVKAITQGRQDDLLLAPGDIIFVPESAI